MGQVCCGRARARQVVPHLAQAADPPPQPGGDKAHCDEVVVEQQLLPQAAPAGSAQEVAANLAGRGFSLEQLLRFYLYFSATGEIDQWTTTAEVVRKIVIPQTRENLASYMESDFMVSLGGPKKAATLVSHAWKNRFVNTVTSIVAHACGLSKDSGYLERCEFQDILRKSPPEVLAKTYWLCIFAVRQHLAICGDCWTCSKSAAWVRDPARHLAANPCLVCDEPKHNPCECGTLKLTAGDPGYEIDKFDLVVERMETLLVSLDADLNTVRRVWVCAEVGTAASRIPVQFVMAEPIKASLLRQRLEANQRLLPPVADCESSSREDKARILEAIESSSGGAQAFDELVRILLEVNFGFLQQLSTVPRMVGQALARLTYLDIDCTWLSSMTDTKELFGTGEAFRALQLRILTVNLAGCSRLSKVAALACALRTQSKLEKLALYLQESGLDDGCADLIAAAMPSTLHGLTLKIWDTHITDKGVAAIMARVPQAMRGSLAFAAGNRNHRWALTAAALFAIAACLPPTLEDDLELALLHTPADSAGAALLAGRLPPKLKGSLLLHLPKLDEDGGKVLVGSMPRSVRRLRLQLRPRPPGAYAAVTRLAVARLSSRADVQVVEDEELPVGVPVDTQDGSDRLLETLLGRREPRMMAFGQKYVVAGCGADDSVPDFGSSSSSSPPAEECEAEREQEQKHDLLEQHLGKLAHSLWSLGEEAAARAEYVAQEQERGGGALLAELGSRLRRLGRDEVAWLSEHTSVRIALPGEEEARGRLPRADA